MQMAETLLFFNRALLKNADIKKQRHKTMSASPYSWSQMRNTRTKKHKTHSAKPAAILLGCLSQQSGFCSLTVTPLWVA